MSVNYIKSLDGMRGVSILLVVLSHLGLSHFVPGGFGVTVFFFISGFIITRVLFSELDKSNTISFRNFYLRRFFRLAPALLFFVLLANLLFYTIDRPIPFIDNLAAIFYFANYYHIYFGWGGDFYHAPLSIVWSLSVEEHFYFVFPFLMLLLARNPTRLLKFLFFVCAAVLVWRSYIVIDLGVSSFESPRTYKSTDTRIDSMAYGCILSVYYHSVRSGVFRPGLIHKTLFGPLGLTVAVVGLLLTFVIRDPLFRESIRYSLQSFFLIPWFGFLFCHFSQNKSGLSNFFSSILSTSPLVYIGKISYSLYLHHWLALCFVQVVYGRDDMLLVYLVSVPIMIVFSVFSYHCIENPARRWGARLLERR